MWVKQCHFYHPWLGMVYTTYLCWFGGWFIMISYYSFTHIVGNPLMPALMVWCLDRFNILSQWHATRKPAMTPLNIPSWLCLTHENKGSPKNHRQTIIFPVETTITGYNWVIPHFQTNACNYSSVEACRGTTSCLGPHEKCCQEPFHGLKPKTTSSKALWQQS